MTKVKLKEPYDGVKGFENISRESALEKIETFFKAVGTNNSSKDFDELYDIIKLMDHFGDEARKEKHVIKASLIVGAHINDMRKSHGRLSEINRLASIVKAQELYKTYKNWLPSLIFTNNFKENTDPSLRPR